MKTIYKLTQLAKNNAGEWAWAGVEHFSHLEDKIDLPIDMPNADLNGLAKWCEGDWHNTKYAVVEHDSFCDDGYTPINGRVVNVWDSFEILQPCD